MSLGKMRENGLTKRDVASREKTDDGGGKDGRQGVLLAGEEG